MIEFLEGMTPHEARILGGVVSAVFWGVIVHLAFDCPIATCIVALVSYLFAKFIIRLCQDAKNWRDI